MFICRGDDDPPQFEVGDLLFMDFKGDFDLTVGLYNDHVALFVGTHPTEPGNDWFIDAGWGGVDYTKFSTFEAGKENFLIAQVKDIELEDIEDAVQWARGRIGDEYQFYWPLNWSVRKWNDPDNPDPKDPPGYARHDKWYCTEFVWAAYYNYPVEIDIDNNEWCERLFGQPCVNIGCMGNRSMPEWMIEYICPYIFKNEILIDDDINVTWKEKGIYGFPAGTQIQLESGGTANIENVRVEDFVVSFDERQNYCCSSDKSLLLYSNRSTR